jgi:hypothetical protein
MSSEAALGRAGDPPSLERFDFEVTDARVACLSQLLGQPATHIQRFVEKLSFLPSAGQRWERELQIRIPPDADPTADGWWIVSLGEYTQGRLADFQVADASGRRLNLVTRRQHGDALTEAVTRSFVPITFSSDENKGLLGGADDFRKGLFDFFTSSHAAASLTKQETANALESAYRDLLRAVDFEDNEYDHAVGAFADALGPWVGATQYLCWVNARPGEMVWLRTSYSLADPKQRGVPSFPEEARSALTTLAGARKTPQGRARLADLYRGLGLAPIDYSFNAPTGQSAPGSYYFILQQPPATEVTYFDWEYGWQMAGEGEWSDVKCAYPAAHIHSTTSTQSGSMVTPSNYTKIRAYLRCAPYRHKQILGAVALNLAVVFLLSHGRLPAEFSEPLQGLIIAAPSVVIGYMAQQQRHYYSDVMRRQRFLLWGYLAISIAFLVSVAFSERDGTPTLQIFATGTAWLLAIASGGVLGWQLLLGSSYARSIGRIAHKDAAKRSAPMWEHYGVAVRRYGTRVLRLVLLGMFVAGGLMALFWDSEDPPASSSARPQGHQGEKRSSVSNPGQGGQHHQGTQRFHYVHHKTNAGAP